MAGKPLQNCWFFKEHLYQLQDDLSVGIVRKDKHDESREVFWRVVANIGKIKIAGQKTTVMAVSVCCNASVWRPTQPDVAHVHGFMTEAAHEIGCWTRKISVDYESHVGQSDRKWVM